LQLVGFTTNPLEGIEIIRSQKVDLVFLDIQMDEMNGIEVMRVLPKDVSVIFCTAYSEFAVDSYEVEAVDYLLKPVSFNRFVKAVQRATNLVMGKAVEELSSGQDDYIFIKTEQKGKMVKINFNDIEYIEGMKNYVAFRCGKEKILAYLTMKDLEQKLPHSQFMRVHKSYIVALRLITAVESSTIVLKDRSERIPLSESYREAFLEHMKNKLLL
jgi:two-component system LytT family response regulator